MITLRFFFFVLLVSFSSAASAQDRVEQFGIADIESILSNEGYSGIERLSDNLIALRVDGTAYGIIVSDNGDLQGYYGLSGTRYPLEVFNEWNQTKRFSRAYRDADGDAVLEFDLDAAAGLTKAQVAQFVRLFIRSSEAFRDFVTEK